MGNDLKLGVVKQHKTEKPQGYACQICRASREICQRCQSAKYVMRMTVPTMAAPTIVPTARRGRPRATLSAYR
jgi:hypothetical protein